MATKEQALGTTQQDNAGKDAGGGGTFETDISETGDDGTTVRQAEVSEQELQEVKPASEGGGQKESGSGRTGE
ncbi:hypothetical protein [Paraburkholderia rhizosphaerae]|uniref:Uncharacterized protein n=1 Tax=Paraburkholderia rhizosphaerae TaxID=480658 RepID=A0A4R8LWW6_9BURK|nr:hypothetical protein [Paraburkholderia rhizosphaerae]TDY52434.1 hypothetical protein BX592_105320 [Paraburkholderia rhizosphaerae]